MTTILYFFFPRIANYPAIPVVTYQTTRMVIDNAPAEVILDNPGVRLTIDNQ